MSDVSPAAVGRRRARRRHRSNLPAFAYAGPGCALGWPRTVTAPERITLGRGVVLGDGVWLALATERPVQVTQGTGIPPQAFDPRLVIGDRTRFGSDLTIGCLGRVTIGADVWGEDRILIADSYHDYSDPDRPIAQQPMAAARAVTIGAGAFLGTGVTINPGVTIGPGAVIAPGAVVTRDVPAHTHAVGAPARVSHAYT